SSRSPRHPPDLPSFPTRRSSDLVLQFIMSQQFDLIRRNSQHVLNQLPRDINFLNVAFNSINYLTPQFKYLNITNSRFQPCKIWRSEEHTSELQSRENLVCRLLLE